MYWENGIAKNGWIHGFFQYAEYETKGIIALFEEEKTGNIKTFDPAREQVSFQEW